MKNLTELEKSVLKEIASANPELEACLSELAVSKREYSGAGSFTHFKPLENPINGYPELKRLTLSKVVALPKIKNGLGGFLEVLNGSPDMLELHTFGEESWSGNEEGYCLE